MGLKEALFYKKLEDDKVQCQLCPRFCVIKNGERGNCGVRENMNGKLFSLVYGKPCSIAIDPIEKKPFYHFLPGTKSLSIATVGCNFHCLHCQNYAISQARVEDVPYIEAKPEEIVEQAKANDVKSISFTYTEPTVFYEYMLDIAKLAKKEKIKCNIVSNGFINEKPLKKLIPYVRAANIDLKGNALFYEKICQARIEPVLETIKLLHSKKVWVELTNLIIPGYNDNVNEIKKMVSWILENLGKDVPLHFSAFYPAYKLTNVPSTEPEFLIKARILAKHQGLSYVYTGNILDEEGSTTFCAKCDKVLIIRKGFRVVKKDLKRGRCSCGEKIPGVWR
ncbi:MAG: AmmeMemoRadiSam system radical SAM enzyme [Candidatus Pacearchaeota archaeon]